MWTKLGFLFNFNQLFIHVLFDTSSIWSKTQQLNCDQFLVLFVGGLRLIGDQMGILVSTWSNWTLPVTTLLVFFFSNPIWWWFCLCGVWDELEGRCCYLYLVKPRPPSHEAVASHRYAPDPPSDSSTPGCDTSDPQCVLYDPNVIYLTFNWIWLILNPQ